MIHLFSLSGLFLVLNGPPSTGSCLCSLEKAPLSFASTVEGAALSTSPDDEGPAYHEVPRGNWTYNAIVRLQRRNVLKGYPAGVFSGNRCTRYEFAVFRATSALAAASVPQEVTAKATLPQQEAPAPLDPVLSAEDLKLLRKLH